MLNYHELRLQAKRERHILGLLPSNVDEKQLFNASVLLGSILLCGVMLVVGCLHSKPAHADEVDCIIGEASGEGQAGMIAVAQAIKNRGSLDGIYGCKAKHIKTESQDTRDLARWVWIQVGNPNRHPFDLVKGANSWGTDEDIAKNHMDKNCKETATVGRHHFFKCEGI